MVNWGGALSGAGTGALAGSAFGPWGTAIGGVIGGLGGLLTPDQKQKLQKMQGQMGMGAPEGYSAYSLPTMGGGQQDIYNMLKGAFMGQPSQGGAGDVYKNLLSMAQGKSDAFEQLEAPALAQFQQQIAPGIAQRYAGSGIGSSSGMQNAIAGAGANLAQNLQGQRMGLMQQSIHDVLGLGNMLLGMPTQQFGLAQNPTGMADFMRLLGNVGAQAAGTYFGNKFARGGGSSGIGGGI